MSEIPRSRTALTDDEIANTPIAAAYRAGFDDGCAAAKDGHPPRTYPGIARLARRIAQQRLARTQGAANSAETGPDNSAIEPDEVDQAGVYTEEDLQTALSHFRKRRAALERDSMNKYAAIGVATGNMAIAATHTEAVAAFEARYGPAKTLTFHIGTTR